MLIADVILEQTTFSFDKPYGYAVPGDLAALKPGCRVIVPFGKGNSMRQGMVLRIFSDESDIELKPILNAIDDEPILSDEMLRLCEWMHEHCFCTYFEAVKAVLPFGISFTVHDSYKKGNVAFSSEYSALDEYYQNKKIATAEQLISSFSFLNASVLKKLTDAGMLVKEASAVRRMNDSTVKSVRLKVSLDELENIKLTPRRREIAKMIAELGVATIKEINYFTGVSPSVIYALREKGIVEVFDKEVYRSPIKMLHSAKVQEVNLTEEQETTYRKLEELYRSPKGEAALLYGVTGSGKTSVFLKLTEKAISENRGVIIMVPEISLTPQTVEIFGGRYGDKVALFHSSMSAGQRMDEWKRVKNGEATVVIGTRSAIFAPVKNLSLIIIDEEQEHTYKSEKSPRFHARDLAKFRVAYNNALLLMASATPSIESYTSAKLGKYSLCTIEHRYGKAELPEVKTVDMREELRAGNVGPLSATLKSAVSEALENGHQAIILLNRRGHNTYISCPLCGYVAVCPNCSISMTYHSANRRMMCHYCGYSTSLYNSCPSCGNSDMRFSGVGTQRIEEELNVTFPEASVLRLDADSTSSKDSFSVYLDEFAKGKYDIMLGTQMVAKGLNFPNVTVVGVVGADSVANSSDYRSFERSFSLLTQVFGRAGRGDNKGIAVIQTTDPDSNLIKLAAAQDYKTFYEQEIKVRKMMIYPPYCDLAQIVVQSLSKETAEGTAFKIFASLTEAVKGEYSDVKIKILGPSEALCPKVNNKYRYRLLIKAKNSKRFRELLRSAATLKTAKETTVSVDINPDNVV